MRKYQQIMTTTVTSGGVKTFKTSFKTLESAIADAEKYIYKKESWMSQTVTAVDIVDKETKEIVWSYRM